VRIFKAALATAVVLLSVLSANASTFQDGVTIRTGITTLTAPPDLDAAAALLGPASDRTLHSVGLGYDFSSGNNAFNVSGTTIRGSCLVLQQFCGAFSDPADPNFLALIIHDFYGQLDPIVNVTSSVLSVYFNANTIILDISGLSFPTHPATTLLATVEFGPAQSEVPLPAALPLFVSGLAAIGLIARRRRRKQALA
jgi:hypothetical protein